MTDSPKHLKQERNLVEDDVVAMVEDVDEQTEIVEAAPVATNRQAEVGRSAALMSVDRKSVV